MCAHAGMIATRLRGDPKLLSDEIGTRLQGRCRDCDMVDAAGNHGWNGLYQKYRDHLGRRSESSATMRSRSPLRLEWGRRCRRPR